MSMAVSKSLRKKIFERDNYTCQYCKNENVDENMLLPAHIRTYSLCGDDRESNLITLCRHCYNHVPNNEIRNRFETKENSDYFWELYNQKVAEYSYYTNYIKKALSENGVNMTRPQIDKYVNIKIKNDDDFEVFKSKLKEIGIENIRKEMQREIMLHNRKQRGNKKK